jgi:hypothetical protein
MSIEFEYVVDKIMKMDNGEVEIIATGISTENIAKTVNPEMEMLMKSIPPQLGELMNQQTKIFQNVHKPMIKFRLTEKEYKEGNWKVGETIEVTIREGNID